MSLQATSDPARALPRRTTSVSTIAAIGAVDYVLATLVHEAASDGGVRVIASLGAGAAALAYLRRVPTYRGCTWYAAWLFAAVSLFMGSGDLLVSPILGMGRGDFGAFGLTPPWVWTFAECALGAVASMTSLVVVVRAIDPLLGEKRDDRQRRARLLAWLPYLTGCAIVTLAAFGHSRGTEYVASSALATFGATSFLAWLPVWIDARRVTYAAPLHLPVDARWIVAGLLAALVCVALVGRGFARAI